MGGRGEPPFKGLQKGGNAEVGKGKVKEEMGQSEWDRKKKCKRKGAKNEQATKTRSVSLGRKMESKRVKE